MPAFHVVKDTMTPRIRQQLKALNGANRRAILAAVGSVFAEITRGTIGASGKHRISPWRSLSPEYSKRIGGRTTATLQMTAGERSKFGKPSSLPHLAKKISVTEITGAHVTVTADVPYAATHQLGHDRVPARKFFPVNENEKVSDYAGAQIRDTIEKKLKQFKAI